MVMDADVVRQGYHLRFAYYILVFVVMLFMDNAYATEDQIGTAAPPSSPGDAVHVSLNKTLLPRGTGRITSLAVIDGEGNSILVGTERGELFLTRDGGGSWMQVKKTTVVHEFLERIREIGPDILEQISEVDSDDIEQFFAIVDEGKQPVEFDLSDISYEDLSFEDIDLNAVDPSDVEFRDDYIDPGEVVLEDLDEDDIENIEITDESYLLNPDDIRARFAEEQEQEQEQAVSEERQVSEDNLRRLLLHYAGTFLSVRNIILVRQAEHFAILACTPLAVFQSLDGAQSWSPLKLADWEHGQYFISCVAGRNDRKRAIIVGPQTMNVTFDGGVTWESGSIQGPAVIVGMVRFLDGEQTFAGLTGEGRLVRVPLSVGTFKMSAEEILLPPDYADEISLFDIGNETLLVVTSLGMVLSEDNGKKWREVLSPESNPAALQKILIADNVRDTILAVYRDKPLLSIDNGQNWITLHLGGAFDRVTYLDTFFTTDRRLLVFIIDDEEISILTLPVDKNGRPVLPADIAAAPPVMIERPAVTEGPSVRLLSLNQALERAHRFHLWDLSEFGRWRKMVSRAGYMPRLSITASYLDQNQTSVQYTRGYQFSPDPDYYTAGPWTRQYNDYRNEYFTINFSLQWDLSRIMHPLDALNVNTKLINSHRRMERQEKKIRTILTDRIRMEERSRTEQSGPVAAEVERLLRIQELDALLWMLSDGTLTFEGPSGR